MSLHIQHPEASQLAEELSKLTGEPMSEAVVIALRERIERQVEIQEMLKQSKAVTDRVAKMINPDGLSAVEHGDFLYDEKGLPK